VDAIEKNRAKYWCTFRCQMPLDRFERCAAGLGGSDEEHDSLD
jgi:hypothetical protein